MSFCRWLAALTLTFVTGCDEQVRPIEPTLTIPNGGQIMHVSEIGERLREHCSAPKRLGWIPYWDQKRASASFRDNVDLFSHVSMFWYYLDRNGKIRTYRRAKQDQDLLGFARAHGVKTLALIANDGDHSTEDWDRRRVARIIGDQERRRAHVEDLVKLADSLDFDGINIDYEALHRRDLDDFTQFISELATALHALDKILAVAIHPKTAIADPSEDNGSHAQDLPALAQVADQLHLMTYGEHGGFSGPGPIASGRWLDNVLGFVLDEQHVPADRLFLGVPVYAEAWKEKMCWTGNCLKHDTDLVFTDLARRRAKAKDAQIIHAGVDGARLSYEQGGRQRQIWYEDSASVLAKLDLAAERGVCNAAFWRLGGEDSDIWQSLRDPDT